MDGDPIPESTRSTSAMNNRICRDPRAGIGHNSGMANEIDDSVLQWLEDVSLAADPPPWRSMVEGRDHVAGDSFIMVGRADDRAEDIHMSRDSGPAKASDLDRRGCGYFVDPKGNLETTTARSSLRSPQESKTHKQVGIWPTASKMTATMHDLANGFRPEATLG